jgi:hypothetical protein
MTAPNTSPAAAVAPKSKPKRRSHRLHTAGLTTAPYSFGYVAHWSGGDAAAVKTTAEWVITTARNLLDACGTLQTEAEPLPVEVAA